MGKFSRIGTELYDGRRSIDFVGRKWVWYTVSAVLLLASIGGLAVRELNFGIEFKGGVEYSISLPKDELTQANADKIQQAVSSTGIEAAKSPIVSTGGASIRVDTKTTSNDNVDVITRAIVKAMDIPTKDVSTSEVGASWGHEVADRAVKGLIIFLILVVLFIWAYFREWKMSVAAVVALAHDLTITVGVYALSGFEVTPATVTGVLTILGFSLYDTVVVFDKIRENTKNLRQGRRTYSELANLAVNQTLVRSINTSIVALLPVAAILYVGIVQLGSGPLKDLALALFVGMAVGAYSSIFIATPLLVQLKQTEKEITEADRRARARAKRDIDRYADVPSFVEGMPVSDDPDGEPEGERAAASREPFRAPSSRPSAAGSGRVVPTAKAPVEDSGSAHRPQPTRQPRSKRK
jgi:preprotein translocase subunit SecF